VLIAVNWFFYIYSVDQRQVVQASLGYFITPLVSVGLGMIFFHERLRRLQAVALALALVGVVILTVAVGELPWIALILAGSFGLYGLLRKAAPVDGLVGLSVETSLLLPLATGFLLWPEGAGIFGHHGWELDMLLVCSGVVTAVPLMCFAQAARRLPLSALGFLQYLSPSVQFLLAVLAFHEDFEAEKAISFGCIWAALALFSIDAVRAYRLPGEAAVPVENP
jgi:chloramphenicol-sensitive protein RarD